MTPEVVALVRPVVDTQPAYNLLTALWTELPPEAVAHARHKLAQCARDLEEAAKHIRRKLRETESGCPIPGDGT